MRIPNAAHEAQPWRIREIAHDFTLEDVWALPVHGGPGDFGQLLETMAALDPADSDSALARLLWDVRDRLGAWFGLGTIKDPADERVERPPIPGTTETTLATRLPADLRDSAAPGLDISAAPFSPLYRTDTEAAAEISNRTMHGVMHLAWADEGGGRYRGQMAVYVKPNGPLGTAYMALIKPFRYLIVYPALMRQMDRTWRRRPPAHRVWVERPEHPVSRG